MIGEEIHIFDWFKLHFVENEGMAFGMQLGGDYGKLILSSFRIIAVFFLIFILRNIIRKPDTTLGLTLSLSLILAGAIGNIIDSVLYGIIFSDSHSQVATFLPEAGGYAGVLYGKVVDMLHFPIYQGWLPVWIPIWGGDYIIFFRPVFNIADASITLGVFSILIFQRNFFSHFEDSKETAEPDTNPLETASGDLTEAETGIENQIIGETEELGEGSSEIIPASSTSTPLSDALVHEQLNLTDTLLEEQPEQPDDTSDTPASDDATKE